MPTKQIGIFDTGQTLFVTPRDKVGKITSIFIDNRNAERNITINDQFSGDVSNGVASPTVNSGVLLVKTVRSGQQIEINTDMLKDIRTLGTVSAYADASTNVVVVANYHFE